MRDLVHRIIEQTAFCDDGETTDQHETWQQEEAQIVERDRANTHPTTGGLFQGRFKTGRINGPLPLIRDAEDGVDRCPACAWEIEEGGNACVRCGANISSSAGSTDDESDIVRMLQHDQPYASSSDDDDDFDDNPDMMGGLEWLTNQSDRSNNRSSTRHRHGPQATNSVNLVSDGDDDDDEESLGVSDSGSGSNEDDEGDDDDDGEEEDALTDGFIDDGDESATEAEITEIPNSSSSPPRQRNARRGNPYIVESSSSSEEEGGHVSRPTRRSRHTASIPISDDSSSDESL